MRGALGSEVFVNPLWDGTYLLVRYLLTFFLLFIKVLFVQIFSIFLSSKYKIVKALAFSNVN